MGGFGDWGNHQISPSNGNQQRQLVGSAIAHSPLLSTIGSMSGSLGASTEVRPLFIQYGEIPSRKKVPIRQTETVESLRFFSMNSFSISFFFLKTQQLQRLREEVASQQVKMANLEESLSQARKACDAWRCKALLAEQQRDEVIWIVWYFFSALVGPSFVFLFLLRITKGGSHFYVRCHRNVWKRSIEVFIWLKEINKTRMYYNHFMF